MEKLNRVNLGSGTHYWPGFINVDCHEEADIQSDIADLSYFQDESVDEIYGIHVFEHLDFMQIPRILAEWRRILKPGGKLILEMPSMNKIAQMIVDGEQDIRLTMLGIYGEIQSPNPYMLHKWCWTDHLLRTALEHSGFTVEFKEPVFHKPVRDLRVEGVKNAS